VVERFGRSKHPELDTFVFSNGVRLQPAAAAPVRSVEKGEVLYAGQFMSYGLMALVQHPGNLHSVYAHLGQIHVARGQKISVGEAVGSPGQDDAGRPSVYFELRVGGVAVDPLVWLQ
jgi:murein hydrolase activator